MNKSFFLTALFLLSSGLFSSASFAQVPIDIGGIKLNTDIKQYEAFIRPKTKLPIRFMEYLNEVEISNLPGFKSGYIAYGNCAAPGKIVRIKLKYRNGEQKFFDKLFKEYKARLGKPSEWLGDPFHVVTAWKWTFSDGDTRVNLYLQHNTSDAEQKFGTSVKMTMRNLIETERLCFEEKFPNYRKAEKASNPAKVDGWKGLIPE